MLGSTVSIDPNGTEEIDALGAGVAFTLTAQYSNATLMSDGTGWHII